jgi:transposase InsO family protein
MKTYGGVDVNTILTEELWDARNWQLHHDNAPAHSSHLIQGFLAKHGIPQVHQVPYSPVPEIEDTAKRLPL